MKKLTALFLTAVMAISLTACDNGSSEPETTRRTTKTEEKRANPFSEPTDSSGDSPFSSDTPAPPETSAPAVFDDPLYFQPLELLGYVIKDNGDVFIPIDDWQECNYEGYEYFFGVWDGPDGTVTISESDIEESDELYIRGNTVIWGFWDGYWQFLWLSITDPDTMYFATARGPINGEFDFEVNIYDDYEGRPLRIPLYTRNDSSGGGGFSGSDIAGYIADSWWELDDTNEDLNGVYDYYGQMVWFNYFFYANGTGELYLLDWDDNIMGDPYDLSWSVSGDQLTIVTGGTPSIHTITYLDEYYMDTEVGGVFWYQFYRRDY